MRTALVNYEDTDGILKCTLNVDQHNNEVRGLKSLTIAPWLTLTLKIPYIMAAFQTNDGYHCLVMNMLKGYSLREHMSMIPGYQKDFAITEIAHYLSGALIKAHSYGFAHGNITPDTVYIRHHEYCGFEILFVNAEGLQPLLDHPQATPFKPEGYAPPEDFVESESDQRRRDAWMLGATLYSLTNGHPPYGFAYSESHRAMLPVPAEELQRTMKQVAETGKNSYPPIQTSNSHLLRMIEDLLKPKPEDRITVGTAKIRARIGLEEDIPLKNRICENLDYLKSLLPIVGTPSWQVEPPLREHVEDTSTRYKNP
ncbi:kinase-like domain-containing protein [Thamnocephalis sphaerospora]|uniref:Kinase-like domain-containing protein n=1 Tax=Thamnocephalis sphaerospora TaxID=78915 RepID=A0A4P9XQ79_9FUNG|nr:kinase-like domain-containing protein [Thamnocephalis sphaerospora]|eukprot:RKP07430.1 kinase-like domain-containing protein [Thamnocephalis sphaerospora]